MNASLLDQPPLFLGAALVILLLGLLVIWALRESVKYQELARRNLINSVRADNFPNARIRFDGRTNQCRRAADVADRLGWNVCDIKRKSWVLKSIWFSPNSDESATRAALLQAMVDADLVHEIALPSRKQG